MASNKKKSKKRLARAKVKTADEKSTRSGSKHAAGKSSSSVARHLHNPDGTLDRKKVITGVVIVVFAIVMALSLMLPSLAPIFANKNNGQQQDQQSQQSDSNNNSSDSSNSESSEAANSVVSTTSADPQRKLIEDVCRQIAAKIFGACRGDCRAGLHHRFCLFLRHQKLALPPCLAHIQYGHFRNA